jgi:NAD(P)H-dependent FMN reductase
MHVVAITGSLRRQSTSTELLRAASRLAPPGMAVSLFRALDDIPHFSPDDDIVPAPESVTELRSLLAGANAVIFATPEYAHGMPGALKNVLDWLVSSGELHDKRVALFNASPRAHHAQDALAEVLRTMGARVIDAAAVAVPLLGKTWDVSSIIADESMAGPIRNALSALRANA